MSDKKVRVPQIRFAGFTGEWEERKVSEITLFHKQGFYTTESYNVAKKYFLLRGTDLTENKLVLKETPKINATEKDYKDFKAQVGDFLIVRSGTVGTYGIVDIDIPAIFGSYLINFRFDKTVVTNEFFGYFYQSVLFKDQLRQIIQQSANTNINAENIKSTKINIPTIIEQKQIASYLQGLDNLITLQQRQLDTLASVKKTMLAKMFPKDGANVPEIRFAGFTGAWEQRKLGDMAELTSSKRIHAEDYIDSGIPFYRGKEISELRQHKEVSEVIYISQDKYVEISKLYGSPSIGDLLITAVGTLGNTWVVDNIPFYFKDGNLIWFKNIKCNSRYLDYVLSSENGQKKIMDSAIGSNQKALTMVRLNELKFMFPKLAEQKKIGQFFASIDNLLTLHQRELNTLKTLKKSMLQHLFV